MQDLTSTKHGVQELTSAEAISVDGGADHAPTYDENGNMVGTCIGPISFPRLPSEPLIAQL